MGRCANLIKTPSWQHGLQSSFGHGSGHGRHSGSSVESATVFDSIVVGERDSVFIVADKVDSVVVVVGSAVVVVEGSLVTLDTSVDSVVKIVAVVIGRVVEDRSSVVLVVVVDKLHSTFSKVEIKADNRSQKFDESELMSCMKPGNCPR